MAAESPKQNDVSFMRCLHALHLARLKQSIGSSRGVVFLVNHCGKQDAGLNGLWSAPAGFFLSCYESRHITALWHDIITSVGEMSSISPRRAQKNMQRPLLDQTSGSSSPPSCPTNWSASCPGEPTNRVKRSRPSPDVASYSGFQRFIDAECRDSL